MGGSAGAGSRLFCCRPLSCFGTSLTFVSRVDSADLAPSCALTSVVCCVDGAAVAAHVWGPAALE
eukprot:5162854-Amphidinium_carterae.1